jgi:tRNA 2-thiouridine synthesizing protein A
VSARLEADAEWDAGDLGCGELVLELRSRLAAHPPGGALRLIALDAGAPADIPAWCRMTGHTLVSQQHPVYLIRRKET